MSDPISLLYEVIHRDLLRHTVCNDDDATKCPACSWERRTADFLQLVANGKTDSAEKAK